MTAVACKFPSAVAVASDTGAIFPIPYKPAPVRCPPNVGDKSCATLDPVFVIFNCVVDVLSITIPAPPTISFINIVEPAESVTGTLFCPNVDGVSDNAVNPIAPP